MTVSPRLCRLRARLHAFSEFCGDLAKIGGAFALLAVGLLALQVRVTVRQVGEATVTNLNEVGQAAHQAQQVIPQVAQNVADIKSMVNASLWQYGELAKEITDTTREQKKYWDSSGKETVALLQKANRLVGGLNRTDRELRTQIRDVGQASTSLLNATRDLSLAGQKSVNQLHVLLDDPNLPRTVAHLAEASEHADASLGIVQRTLEKPKSIAKAILEHAVSWTLGILRLLK